MTGLRCLVTGASRGLGRGCAVGLAEQGGTVFVTARSMGGPDGPDGLAGTVELVERAGGRGIPLLCDHRDDAQVASVVEQVRSAVDRLDVLVNSATAVGDVSSVFSPTPFWEVDIARWDSLFAVGLRSHFVASRFVVPLMLDARGGLIVNVSSAGAADRIGAILPYGVAKAALDRMTRDMAEDLDPFGVTVVSVWPPPSATPGMLASAAEAGEDPSYMSEPLFTGRVVAALAADPERHRWSGRAVRVPELATVYGIAPMPYRAG